MIKKLPENLNEIVKEIQRFPIEAVARRYGFTSLELSAHLRRNLRTKRPLFVTTHELQYFEDNHGSIPASEMREAFAMSPSQFQQIFQGKLKRRQRKSSENLTPDEAVDYTRRLIEDKLGLDINDDLPRIVTNRYFRENGLSNCVSYAETAKAADVEWRDFTAVAYLVCHAYPARFRPFQFSSAKHNEYFNGARGRGNIVEAARWILEEKKGYRPENMLKLSRNKDFLTNRDLAYYGISPVFVQRQFTGQAELIQEVLALYESDKTDSCVRGYTEQLRKTLEEAGRPLSVCEAIGCGFKARHVHHIVPRRKARPADVHAAHNLVGLCPNHHDKADDANRTGIFRINKQSPPNWRETLLGFLKSQDDALGRIVGNLSGSSRNGHNQITENIGRENIYTAPARR